MLAAFLFQSTGAALIAAAPAAPICLSKPIPAYRGREQIVPAYMLEKEAPAFEKMGFRRASCEQLKLDPKVFVDGVCRMADQGNDDTQRELTRKLGVAPTELCKVGRLAMAGEQPPREVPKTGE